MEPRVSTSCCGPPSAARKRAFPCTRAWRGTARWRKTSCAAPETGSFCPAAARPGKARVYPDRARRHAARHRRARGGRLLHRAGRSRHGATLRAAGGLQTEEDFANGRGAAEFVEPISLRWRGRARRLAVPAQRTGLVALMILGVLEALGPPRRTGRRDALPPAHRGRAPRLPRPERLPRRSPPAGNARQPPHRARLPRRSGAAHRRRARASRFAGPGRERARRRIAIRSRSRSSTATETPAVSSTRSIRTSAAA